MFKHLVDLFFPKICHACLNVLSDNEVTICTNCRHDLPVTNFHLNNDDTVKKVLHGRAKIENATALFRFQKKGITQQLIHHLKYKGYEDISAVLGDWLGGELKSVEAYQDIDLVIPVPLHKKKLRKRGYNQVAKFGQQIAKNLGANYTDNMLVKVSHTQSQITKKRLARWQDSDSLFKIKDKKQLANKHILLVDDIITTGATLEACTTVLKQADGVKISIATMAIA